MPAMRENGIARIARERQRQIEKEDWTPEHDNYHFNNELICAAVAYAVHGRRLPISNQSHVDGSEFFPYAYWAEEWWKPEHDDPKQITMRGYIRHLEKAGALIAAEIDRLLRLQDAGSEGSRE